MSYTIHFVKVKLKNQLVHMGKLYYVIRSHTVKSKISPLLISETLC